MDVVLKALESYGRTMVRCTSENQAKMFMEAMWEQYPELVTGIWRKGQTNWNRNRESEGCIYYLPRIVRSDMEPPCCQSTSPSMHRGDGYKIIEFSDLLAGFDLGELPTPVLDIKSIFGMG